MGMIKRFTAGLTAIAVLAGVYAPVFAAERETPSGVPLDEVGSRIEQWASENESEYPSFAVAVVNGDELVYSGAFGYIDIGNGIEATPDDSAYEWGSCSKTMIWVSVMQLWEQGLIDLEADVRDYLPEGFFHNLKYDDPITMLNLMNHDAGWGEATWAMQSLDENNIMDLGEALQYTEPVQMYRPGEVSSYSNWGAALAGYVVECITGQSYEDYVREHIFDVLGMEHTAISPVHNDNEWVYERRQQLVCYSRSGDSWVSKGHQLC
jgi:CubicO group peptidase (beta-lactamase class C family)